MPLITPGSLSFWDTQPKSTSTFLMMGDNAFLQGQMECRSWSDTRWSVSGIGYNTSFCAPSQPRYKQQAWYCSTEAASNFHWLLYAASTAQLSCCSSSTFLLWLAFFTANWQLKSSLGSFKEASVERVLIKDWAKVQGAKDLTVQTWRVHPTAARHHLLKAGH